MRIWQSKSPYEIVADGSNKGGNGHQIDLFYERYWLAGVSGRGCGRRVASGGKNSSYKRQNLVGCRWGIAPQMYDGCWLCDSVCCKLCVHFYLVFVVADTLTK